MALSIADQIALDDALVAPADRLKIGKCNLRLSSDITSKEATLQVVYDVLKLTPLGHSGDIRKLSDVNVNKLHQPWRSFAAVINKCLCGTPSYDSLRLSQAQILWGMYNQKNVDYAIFLETSFSRLRPKVRRRAVRCTILGSPRTSPLRQKEARRKQYRAIPKWEAFHCPQAPEAHTHDDEIIHEKDTDEDDSSISSSDEDDSDNDVEGAKVAGAKSSEDATDAKDQVKMRQSRIHTDLDGRDKVMTDVEDTHVTLTSVILMVNNRVSLILWISYQHC
ncbi:hypothetical protein Tco_1092120 [Tanacetum coccineum]|uniref:Uncharacterized protein n=1 Tax=Tanacetum coccineum TaxID=301880 RepID=A0ABQ5I8Y1_9ASTR